MESFIDTFASKQFDEKKMKEMLPSPVYKKWKETIDNKDSLDRATADVIAHAMKSWAVANGCTHYTHWFLPLTGVTAEKHDSFVDFEGKTPILKFSGKNLIKGEPDASSFPSGGLRATFEARGYTFWDCTSPAFIKDNILCIPTVFVSFTGEALDTKAPLLKSMEAVSKAAVRIINIFGDKDVTSVTPSIGLEQEYFLVDKEDYLARKDLFITGRTLLGSLPSKGQELETHYFGSIPTRVQAFMKDVNKELWDIGIYAKSEHNEVAPGQFELAPIFSNCNIAVDQNQMTMEILQKTALKHGLVCILTEKPFKGVNGSGKHNNYSLITNTGVNLFDPGKNPHENIQFLTFACAFIKAVDEHPELIRLFSSCPGNDHRLGASEAPPAIVSIFLGTPIEDLFNQLIDSKPNQYTKSDLKEFGISTLSYLPRDNSDRNRTSPVAFTGNKFEIRMLGSSMSAAYLNMAVNTMMADALDDIADKLESYKYRQDIRKAALDTCVDIISSHKKVLFSGDGYSDAWMEEASKRGLPNIPTFFEAIKYCKEKKSTDIFVKNGVLTELEVDARLDILFENNYKMKSIEAKTLVSMMKSTIIPMVNANIAKYAASKDFMPTYIKNLVYKLCEFVEEVSKDLALLSTHIATAEKLDSFEAKCDYLLAYITPAMDSIRAKYDVIEADLDETLFSFPTYETLFFKLDN